MRASSARAAFSLRSAELRGLLDVDVPREVQVEIGRILAPSGSAFGQTGVLVRRREAADAQRLAHGVLDARWLRNPSCSRCLSSCRDTR